MIVLYFWLRLKIIKILLHWDEKFIMEVVDSKIRNSLFELFDSFFILFVIFKYTLKNMVLQSSSEMKMGNKGNKSINSRKSSSNFYYCWCETYICNLINPYKFITSYSRFITNPELSWIFSFKFDFLYVHILIVDKVSKSDGVQEVFPK